MRGNAPNPHILREHSWVWNSKLFNHFTPSCNSCNCFSSLKIYDGGIGAQVMGAVDCAYFVLNEFKSLSITSWYSDLPLITFKYAFHTSSTETNPCTKCSLDHNVDSYLHEFGSMSITIWYNNLPLSTFKYAFHTSSTKPNPCTNFFLDHKSKTFIIQFLNI